MQKESLQNNIIELFSSLQSGLSKNSGTSSYGRALISDGKISFWVKIKDQKIMNIFEKQGISGFYLKTGFNVRKSDSDAYGLEMVPVTADISSDYIPDLAKTTLSDIVKNQEFFTTKGLGSPPVWFVDVKIENIERYDQKIDVRD